MKVTIFAATGGIGGQLLQQAVAAGHDVTAVVRNPKKLSAPIRVVAADLASPDPAVLQAAVRGADAVLSGLGARSSADNGVAWRGTRAIIEAMAFQTVDVVDAVTRATGTPLTEMRVDGGASVMNLLCQFQADVLGVPVRRAAIQQTTALGAAFLAGLAEGVWASPEQVNTQWSADASFVPAMDGDDRARRLLQWRRAVERSRDWARE